MPPITDGLTLQQWFNSAHRDKMTQSYIIIDLSSKHGFINILNWWWERRHILNYSVSRPWEIAFINGQFDTITWWTDHMNQLGISIKFRSLRHCMAHGNLASVLWWKDHANLFEDESYDDYDDEIASDFSEESEFAIDIASRYGHLHILKWWVDCEFADTESRLNYSDQSITGAATNGHVMIIQWWWDQYK
jgi:hypothetical protein